MSMATPTQIKFLYGMTDDRVPFLPLPQCYTRKGRDGSLLNHLRESISHLMIFSRRVDAEPRAQ